MNGRCRSVSWIWLLAAVTLAHPTTAQEQVLDLFGSFVGTWEGTGTLFGASASFDMKWTRLGPNEFRLEFANAMLGEDGSVTPILRATANYSIDPSGAVTADWEDDRPQTISIEGVVQGEVLRSEWTASAERGVTEYTLAGPDRITVRDWVRADGALRPFGEATYTRVEGD